MTGQESGGGKAGVGEKQKQERERGDKGNEEDGV